MPDPVPAAIAAPAIGLDAGRPAERAVRVDPLSGGTTLVPEPFAPFGLDRRDAERDLRHLGYGVAEFRPMTDRVFRDAVRAYQRRIGADPTGSLTFEQGERLRNARRALTETPVTAGQMMLVAGQTQVVAAGTWAVIGGQADFSVNRSYISCQREQGVCVEAVARLAASEGDRPAVLSSELVTYRVVTWTSREVVAEIRGRCSTQVLTLRTMVATATLADRPHATLACRTDTAMSGGIRSLQQGAEPIGRYYEERRAGAAADISSRENRVGTDRTVAGDVIPGPRAVLR